jgi:hypothetical protein
LLLLPVAFLSRSEGSPSLAGHALAGEAQVEAAAPGWQDIVQADLAEREY